jgi:hypothetical protein
VPADEPGLGQQAVRRVGDVCETAGRPEHDEPAVRPVDLERVQDLSRVDADAGPWSLQSRTVDDDLEIRYRT